MSLRGTTYKLSTIQDNISCDYIISGKHKFKFKDRKLITSFLFEDIDPGFRNDYSEGDILVAGYNFGCGSTREQAPKTLLEAGVRIIVAKSFSQTFYKNAFNIGMLLVECNTDHIENRDEIDIDLHNGYIRNINQKIAIKITPINPKVLKLFYDGGLINHLVKSGNQFNL